MLPSVEKENLETALQVLERELQANANLKSAFRKALHAFHPDKGGEPESFNIIDYIYKAAEPVLKNGANVSKAEKVVLAQTLRELPKTPQELIIEKITLAHPELTTNKLLHPTIYSVNNTYAFFAQTPLENRYHQFEVQATNFSNLKEAFHDLSGDHLKSKILEDFRAQIENIDSKEELDVLRQTIKTTDEYKVLNTGQGLFTKLTGINTSSINALEKMFQEQEQNIQQSANSNPAHAY